MLAGLLFDIRRHSLHDGPGIRTSLFLKGCPLACLWCHNPEGMAFGAEVQQRPERCIACNSCLPPGAEWPASVKLQDRLVESCPTGALEAIGLSLTPEETGAMALADSSYYGSDGGVTFTGGEPLSQPEYLLAAILACRDRALHVALDTSGYGDPQAVQEAALLCQLVLFDIKHMDEACHRRLTGVSNTPILANLQRFADSPAELLVSLPLIPGLNDDDHNLDETARCVVSLKSRSRPIPPVRILPYHAAAAAKYRRLGLQYQCESIVEPTQELLRHTRSLFESYGIPCSIGGLS